MAVIKTLFQEAITQLAASPQASVTSNLDARLLLANVLEVTQEYILQNPEREVSQEDAHVYLTHVHFRAQGKPLAYITHKKHFWQAEFYVDEAVLIPRPDSELLVETALTQGDSFKKNIHVHEVCVGSGAVILSLAQERPHWQYSASDISADALAVAKKNHAQIIPDCVIQFEQRDLLIGLDKQFDIIIANPPYVPSKLARELAATWTEPVLALDGGSEGLDVYKRLIPQTYTCLHSGGYLILEIGEEQASALTQILQSIGFASIVTLKDLAGLDRVLVAQKK